MDRLKIRDRVRAGAIHLSISATVAILSVGMTFWLWYPGEMAQAQGVSRLVLILIAVDVVIGPLITTLVYVRGKWGLHFDLTVIAAMQTAALLFGLQAIYGGRPVYVVFNVDRFDVVAAGEVVPESLALADPRYSMPRFGFMWTAAVLPEDPDKRSDMLFGSLGGGPDLPQMPEYFVPIEDQREAMVARMHPLEELQKLNQLDSAAWSEMLSGFDYAPDRLGYLPMRANEKDGAVIMEKLTGEILGIRLLMPSFGAPEKGRDKRGGTRAPASPPAEGGLS